MQKDFGKELVSNTKKKHNRYLACIRYNLSEEQFNCEKKVNMIQLLYMTLLNTSLFDNNALFNNF